MRESFADGTLSRCRVGHSISPASPIAAGWRHPTPDVDVDVDVEEAYRPNALFADRLNQSDTPRLTGIVLLASLRANISNPRRPPGCGQVGAPSPGGIRGLDVKELLGLPTTPTEWTVFVLNHAGENNLYCFGTHRLGSRLIAADADRTASNWARGA